MRRSPEVSLPNVGVALKVVESFKNLDTRVEKGFAAIADDIDDLITKFAPLIGVARQLKQPVRELENERVPTLGAPSLRNITALKNDVVDPVLCETTTSRQAQHVLHQRLRYQCGFCHGMNRSMKATAGYDRLSPQF